MMELVSAMLDLSIFWTIFDFAEKLLAEPKKNGESGKLFLLKFIFQVG